MIQTTQHTPGTSFRLKPEFSVFGNQMKAHDSGFRRNDGFVENGLSNYR